MFFDVGFSELFLLAVVGLLILGPERLPAVARTLGGWVRKGRQMASEFQRELEREVDLNEIKELKNEVDRAGEPFREAANAFEEGNSILDKTVHDAKDSMKSAAIAATTVSEPVSTSDVPDTLEHHEPMPSTESSDLTESSEASTGSSGTESTKAGDAT